jgi:hypothetical protein
MTTATRTRKSRRTLTPVTITARYPSFNGRRLENWAAESRDGAWLFERIEDIGTPWATICREPKMEVGLHGTLNAAREFVASGEAGKALERLLAHERGQHASERDPSCARC